MKSPRVVMAAAAAGATAAAVALLRHRRGGRSSDGGILIGNPARYDVQTGLLLGSFFDGIAADVARVAPTRGRVLEVGCGPGHLSIRLGRHGLDVTGMDLDPAMIERAQANAVRAAGEPPTFVAADVAALPFADGSFDLVVSTLSMHHWSDPEAGLAEITRVLRPGGDALIWDIRPGVVPLHRHAPDPVAHVQGSALEVVSAVPWRWPWRLSWTQRMALRKRLGSPQPTTA